MDTLRATHSPLYMAGYKAYTEGTNYKACPVSGTCARAEWQAGWIEADCDKTLIRQPAITLKDLNNDTF